MKAFLNFADFKEEEGDPILVLATIIHLSMKFTHNFAIDRLAEQKR